MKIILFIILSVILITAITLISIANHFVNKILIKTNKRLFEKKEKIQEQNEEKRVEKEKRKIWFETLNKDIYTLSSDNFKLHAHFLQNNIDSNKYVIIVHPYEGRGAYMKYFCEHFYNIGFNILAVDLRTHGLSEGKIYSLGYLERFDILAWIDYVVSKKCDAEIILYGMSMGANAVMMCCCEKLPKNVKAIIEDGGFTSAYEQLKDKFRTLYKIHFLPIVELTSLVAKVRLGFSLNDIDIAKKLSKSNIPILFIHGEKDKLVNCNMVHKLYDSCISEKEKIIIPNGEHIKAVLSDEKLYWSSIKRFIEKYIEI